MKLIKRTQEEQSLIDIINPETKSRILFHARQLRKLFNQWNEGGQRLIIEVMIDDFERNEQMARKRKKK